MKDVVPFDLAAFNDGILTAMKLGIPDQPDLQPTFVMPETKTVAAGVSVDPEGIPFDPYARVDVKPGDPIAVPCAVEFLDRAGEVLDFGIAQADAARLTLLDAQYQQVKGFDHVLLGGTAYQYRQTYPPLALADAVIWQVMVATEDQA